jgi:RNA polymerase sigma-70 factor (family 1)
MYERYFIHFVNLAYKKTGDEELAKELVQDIFVALYKNLDNLTVDSSLDGYLFISLRNRIFYHHRQLLSKKKRENVFAINTELTTSHVSESLESKQLNERLQQQIQLLPDKCRNVFLLSRQEQLSHKQIAERMDISVNTVDQHIQKALRILRQALADYNRSIISVIIFCVSLFRF